jgi:alkylation response protein AidB-like acyl-CoA dehydrogenase
MALGIARNAIEALVDLASAKRPEIETNQALREDRGSQARLAQAEALVSSARLFLFETVERVWRDVLAGREATAEGARAVGELARRHERVPGG